MNTFVALSLLLLQQGGSDEFSERVRPVLEAHCVACHQGPRPKARVDLARFTDEGSARANRDLWLRVRDVLRDGTMPPEGRLRPSEPQRDAVLAWIGKAIRDHADTQFVDPGRVTMRRLNRVEYRNTIRDLFGVAIDVRESFPADAVGEVFDNQGDALSLPPVLLERYLEVAESIADEVVFGRRRGEPSVHRFEDEALRSDREERSRRGVHVLATVGEITTDIDVPRAGHYVLRVRAHASRAGDDLARMELTLDGRVVEGFAVDALDTFECHVHLDAGAARIGAKFTNDYYDPKNPDPDRRDRNLYVHWIEVEGPLDPPPLDGLVERFLPEVAASTAPFEDLVRAMARRCWRRPPLADEWQRLLTFANDEAKSTHERVHRALTALLVSPQFLFRIERHPQPSDPTIIEPLDDHALATRLAYFLWSSTPDRALDDRADRGLLHDPVILQDELDRMLRDPRASALTESFAEQWLQLRRLREAQPDVALFGFDEALREAMIAESLMLFESVLRENRPVRDLVGSNYTFLNERLARHYGIEGVVGPTMRRVPFEVRGRSGLLTHASILTLTSNPTRTSPVKRGKWVMETMLGTPPNPPPANVPPLDESEEATRGASLRERLEQHRKDPNCAVCHTKMDALGFALEPFDPVGRPRERDGAFPIDARGELPDGRTIEGPIGLRDIVLQDRGIVRSLTHHLWIYGLGRAMTPTDRLEVERVLRELLEGESAGRSEVTLRAILGKIVSSRAFTSHRGDDP